MRCRGARLALLLAAACAVVGGSLVLCHRLGEGARRPAAGSVRFGAAAGSRKDALASPQPFKTLFADIAERVVPTVVSVITTRIDTVLFYKNTGYQYFDDPFKCENPLGSSSGASPGTFLRLRRYPSYVEKRECKEQGIGSGVIVAKAGYVITCCQVIAGASAIAIKLSSGRTFRGLVVGSDSLSGIAVLKIAGNADSLPVARIGSAETLRPGDWVLAVGNPFSLTSTVTAGVVSALNRTVDGAPQYQDFIQTDAAINSGNAGGALVNCAGELVGINCFTLATFGGGLRIGFAVPISLARRIAEDLIYKGEVVRGWIGIASRDLDQVAREALCLGAREGVLITECFKGGPAQNAGGQGGDVVFALNGTAVRRGRDLQRLIAGLRPGEKVTLHIVRNGKEMALRVRVARRDEKRIARLESR